MSDSHRRSQTSISLVTVDRAFTKALDLPEAKRPAYLSRLGARDPCLRDAVERLLRLSGETGAFLVPGGALSGPMWHELREQLFNDGEDDQGDPARGYRIIRRLGQGGMAVVYLATREDRSYHKLVALKLLRLEIETEEMVRRFTQERQILARLKHPGIARLVDGGRTPSGRPYLVTEYVDGSTIDTYCQDQNPSLEERLKLFLSVARAVSYAHQNLVVHRDLKPTNILVTPEGHVKLLDFGIAKLMAGARHHRILSPNEPSFRAMTPEYASPEQLQGAPVTTASDVYQLGLLLFEILTGQSYHRSAEQSAARDGRSSCPDAPMRPSTAAGRTDATAGLGVAPTALENPAKSAKTRRKMLQRMLRGDLDAIVTTALQIDPRKRYPNVDLMSQDVERWLRGDPTTVSNTTFWHRTATQIRRHIAAIAAGAAVLALMACLTTHHATRLAMERERARTEEAKAKRISRFVIHVCEGANPERVRGRHITAQTLLDRGAQRISSDSQDEPKTRAELLLLFAGLHAQIGHLDRAIPLVERAVPLARGPKADPQTEFQATLLLGRFYCAEGRFPEAYSALVRAKEIAESSPNIDVADGGQTLEEMECLRIHDEFLNARNPSSGVSGSKLASN